MAILILNKSKCSICDKVLKINQEITSWQAFLNRDHKFWKFSDSGMHEECFKNWKHKNEFKHLYKYNPLLDLEDPKIKEQIQKHGIPEWIEDIIEYRKNNTLNNKI